MKRNPIFAGLLCLLLVVSLLLAACSGNEDSSQDPSASAGTSSETVSDASDSSYQDEHGQYTLDHLQMPAYNFSETEFRVCVLSDQGHATYFSEEIGYDMYTTTDTVLNDAVKTRNDLIEEKYGVTVVAVAVDNVQAAVVQDVSSSTGLYDAAMPFMPNCAALAQDGMLYDLMQFAEQNYLHLEAPWWDQSANQSLSVAGKLYFTIGDISIMQKITSIALTFNKTMYDSLCKDTYGDLYQLVRDHRWTLDLLYEMGKLATADTDGEAGMSYRDTFGLSTANNDAIQYYLASGEPLITKDNQDIPVISIGQNQNSIAVATKVLDLLERGDEWIMNCHRLTGVDNIWQVSLDVFGENRALFRTTAFSAIKKLRAYTNGNDFGIVPLPLIYDTQESYHTPSSARFAYGVCIPMSAPNPEFSAFMLEALSCYAKNTITPAYYDVTLKGRDAKDLESEEMLDQYIFNHVVYDLGVIYDFGNIASMFQTLMSQNSTNIVSTLEGNLGTIQSAIDDCVDLYMEDQPAGK